jgi:hypothetical protein
MKPGLLFFFLWHIIFEVSFVLRKGHAVAQLVEALRNKPAGRGPAV